MIQLRFKANSFHSSSVGDQRITRDLRGVTRCWMGSGLTDASQLPATKRDGETSGVPFMEREEMLSVGTCSALRSKAWADIFNLSNSLQLFVVAASVVRTRNGREDGPGRQGELVPPILAHRSRASPSSTVNILFLLLSLFVIRLVLFLSSPLTAGLCLQEKFNLRLKERRTFASAVALGNRVAKSALSPHRCV
jgi:hypothetical protein